MEKFICENCGQETTIKYGSGRFCSFSCKQKFVARRAAKIGGQGSKLVNGKRCKCSFCGQDFLSKQDRYRHLSSCSNKPASNYRSPRFCEFCNFEAHTRKELYEHQKSCEAKLKLVVPGKGIKGEFECSYCKRIFEFDGSRKCHERVCHDNPNRSKASWEGRTHTEEQKLKASITQKRNLKEGRVFGYKLNHSSKVSYPEQYFMEVLKDLPVKYNFQVNLYQLDFAIPEKKVYIEVDGEQHYTDKRIVAHDKERTEVLNNFGWKCLERIRWSDYQKLDEDSKKEYCNKLIDLLKAQIKMSH